VYKTQVLCDAEDKLTLMASFFSHSYGLPTYNPLKSTLLQLAYNNLTGPNTAFAAQYDIGCTIDLPLMTALTKLGLL
jgi:hypothetical protein